MRARIDRKADAVYIDLTDRPIKDSEEVAEGIIVDYDADGHMVGIEVLDASRQSNNASVLKNFSVEMPEAAE